MPAESFRNAMQELVAAVDIGRADGELSVAEIEVILVKAVETLAPVAAAVRGDEAAIVELAEDAVLAAHEAIDRLRDGRVLKRQAAKTAASFVIPWLVEQVSKSSRPAIEAVDEHVLPYTQLAEQVLHAFNASIR